jgi:hypothetical protein
MDFMDKKKESEIVDSVVESIKLTNGGMEPSEAIAKVAAQKGYSKDIAGRMVEAFNVSKTRKHQKEASGDEKVASFAIADLGRVTSILFPEIIDTPSKEASAAWAPAECRIQESRFFMDEVVPSLSSGVEKHSFSDVDMEQYIKSKRRVVVSAERLKEAAYSDMASTRVGMETALEKLTSYFKHSYHDPFKVVEKSAILKHGERSRKLMDLVHERLHSKEARCEAVFEKSADAKCSSDADSLLDSVITSTDAYIAAARRFSETAARADGLRSAYDKTASFLIKAGDGLVSGAIQSALGNIAAVKVTEERPFSEAVQEVRDELMDPDIEAERKAINAQVVLTDLMHNDEVISKADPYKVVSAFNDISSIAPHAVESPVTMRTFVRKVLEYPDLDPHDIANLLGVEKSLVGKGVDKMESATSDVMKVLKPGA